MDEFVASLRGKGLLDEAAAARIDDIEARRHVPLGRELHALLYLGALLTLAGAGAAVKDRLDQVGPLTIAAGLALAAAACFAFVAKTARPFAPARVAAPNVAFDYVLYLGCGLTGILAGYLEWKWRALGEFWDLYLLAAGLACAGLAYRCDNRLVLSAGIMNLAAWIGVRLRRWDVPELGARGAAFALGAALIALGEASRRTKVKDHFEGTYLRFGVHLALLALALGATRLTAPDLWLLLLACAALGARAFQLRRFETFATALVYAYVMTLICVLREAPDFSAALWIVVLSSGAVLAVLLRARFFFREAA